MISARPVARPPTLLAFRPQVRGDGHGHHAVRGATQPRLHALRERAFAQADRVGAHQGLERCRRRRTPWQRLVRDAPVTERAAAAAAAVSYGTFCAYRMPRIGRTTRRRRRRLPITTLPPRATFTRPPRPLGQVRQRAAAALRAKGHERAAAVAVLGLQDQAAVSAGYSRSDEVLRTDVRKQDEASGRAGRHGHDGGRTDQLKKQKRAAAGRLTTTRCFIAETTGNKSKAPFLTLVKIVLTPFTTLHDNS